MTIQEGIEKAIEGGWRGGIPEKANWVKLNGNWWYSWMSEDEEGEPIELSYPACLDHTQYYKPVFLDPLFWQAIGKVEGWNKQCDDCGRIQANGENCSAGGTHDYGEYRYHMHRFIDFLCDGLTLEEALKRATS